MWKFSRGFLFPRNLSSFAKIKNPPEMAMSLSRLLMYLNHALVANFNVANMSFNAIRENKIIAKISEFTVVIN